MSWPRIDLSWCVQQLLRLRYVWLVLILAVTGFFLAQFPKLVLDGSMERIMLKDDPEREVWKRSIELFGSDEFVAVVVAYPESIWNKQALQQLADVSSAVEQVNGVKRVDSLANSLVVRRVIIPQTKTMLEWLEFGVSADVLRFRALRDPTIRNNLVSDDGKHAGLTIHLSPRVFTTVGLKKEIVADIRAKLDAELGAGNYHITGWPVIHTEIADYMLRDLRVLVPLVVCVVALLLALTFRRPAGVLLPLTTIAVAQIWTVGGLIATGRSISMVTNSLPVIIVAIGTTFCIHVVSQIFRALQLEADQRAAIHGALIKTAPAILLSGLTTMVGFAALKFSPVDSIDEFGMFAVWGVAASTLLSLTLLPMLALQFPLRVRPASAKRRIQVDPARFVNAVISMRTIVWVAVASIVAISGYGLSRIEVETAPVSWFPAESEIRKSADYVNENLAGMTPYNVVVEFERPGGAAELETLRRIEQFQKWLKQQPEVDTTLSIADPIKVVYRSTRRGRSNVLPADQQRLDKVLNLIRSGRPGGIDNLINEAASAANVIIRSSEVSTKKSTAFTDRVNRYLAANFADAKLARITGSAHLSYRTNLHFTSGLAVSLGIGMGLICLIMILLFGSVRLGLLAMVPNVLPVLLNYSILGLCDLNLNSATSITGCIAIGIAVDDTIHFLTAFRDGLKQGLTTRPAIEYALQEVGRPMLITTLVLSCGFSVLLMSSFSPVISLGLLVAIAMVACLLCDTVFLPVLLTAKTPALLRGKRCKQHAADDIPCAEDQRRLKSLT